MTLSARLAAVVTAIAADIKVLFAAQAADRVASLAYRAADGHLLLTLGSGNTIDAGAVPVPFDDYSGSEYLADQPGTGEVLTFTFSEPVQQVWVEMTSATDTDTARVRIDGADPTAAIGTLIHPGQAQPITGTTTVLKVLAPPDTTLTVWGLRR